MTQQHTFKAHVETKCTCGGTITAGYDDQDNPGVIHSLPVCTKFLEFEDPADFLHYINESLLRSKS